MGIGKWSQKVISNDRTTRVMQTTSFSLGEMLFAKTVEKERCELEIRVYSSASPILAIKIK